VEAVHHLDSSRGTARRPLRIDGGPVPRDDLHSRMRLQPRGHRVGGALRQEIDGPALLMIAQQCPIPPSPLEGKVIDTQDTHSTDRGEGARTDRGHYRLPGGRQAQVVGQSRAGTATHGHPDLHHGATGQLRAPRPRRRERLQTLTEDRARTLCVGAAEAPDVHTQLDRRRTPGQVGERASIAAVHTLRRLVAQGAAGGRRTGRGLHGEARGVPRHTRQSKIAQMRQKQVETHRTLLGSAGHAPAAYLLMFCQEDAGVWPSSKAGQNLSSVPPAASKRCALLSAAIMSVSEAR
jgi:hypothetical protein